jgi:hypothetical protein
MEGDVINYNSSGFSNIYLNRPNDAIMVTINFADKGSSPPHACSEKMLQIVAQFINEGYFRCTFPTKRIVRTKFTMTLPTGKITAMHYHS